MIIRYHVFAQSNLSAVLYIDLFLTLSSLMFVDDSSFSFYCIVNLHVCLQVVSLILSIKIYQSINQSIIRNPYFVTSKFFKLLSGIRHRYKLSLFKEGFS